MSTTKRASQKKDHDFSFVSDRRKESRLSGFTLIETLVAVSIIAIAVTGPLFTASRALVAAQTARDQLIASHLAQEGIEYVRVMRDDEYIKWYRNNVANVSTVAWNGFITGNDPASITNCRGQLCSLDTTKPMGASLVENDTSKSLDFCTGAAPLGNCAPLYPSAANNTYSWNINANYKGTLFTRTIKAVDGVSLNDEKIISTVSWSFHGTPYTVTVTDHLTPWQ